MARRRPNTDELKTEIYDSRRPKTPTRKGFESGDVTIDLATPTKVDAPRAIGNERSEPIRVISMKPANDRKQREAKQLKPEIRALSDVLPKNATPAHGMGRLAPPADPKQRRVRELRDWVIWGSVLVIISCVVMLAVWFLAR